MTTPAPLRVAQHQLRAQRRLWRSGLFVSFAQPVLNLVGFGVGVGRLIDRNATSSIPADVSYLAFIGPGLLVAACLITGSGEGTWTVMNQIKWGRGFHAMLASPLRPRDLVAGHTLWVTIRLAVTATAIAIVLLFSDGNRNFGLIGAVAAGVLTGLATALPLAAYSATVERIGPFSAIQRFVITPMYLFGGVFYPVSQLPAAIRPLAYVTPLWHGVELARGFALGRLEAAPALGHAAALIALAAAGYLVARRTFARRLTP